MNKFMQISRGKIERGNSKFLF